MTATKQRIDRIEGSLTPKQAFLLWMGEAHAHGSLVEYGRALKGHRVL